MDPTRAVVFSLLLPGAGHAYVGDWGGAIGRAILSIWVVTTTLALVFQKDLPGSIALAAIFGLTSVFLWLVAAHDAYQAAQWKDSRAILRGRRYLVLTGVLLGVLVFGLFIVTIGARS